MAVPNPFKYRILVQYKAKKTNNKTSDYMGFKIADINAPINSSPLCSSAFALYECGSHSDTAGFTLQVPHYHHWLTVHTAYTTVTKGGIIHSVPICDRYLNLIFKTETSKVKI